LQQKHTNPKIKIFSKNRMTKIRNLVDDLEEQIANSKSVLSKCNNHETTTLVSYYKSPFRNNTFQFADPPTINSVLLESKKGTRIRFCDLCALMRSYIYQNDLLIEDGTIKCDSFLKSIVENTDTTSFFKLAAGFRKILV